MTLTAPPPARNPVRRPVPKRAPLRAKTVRDGVGTSPASTSTHEIYETTLDEIYGVIHDTGIGGRGRKAMRKALTSMVGRLLEFWIEDLEPKSAASRGDDGDPDRMPTTRATVPGTAPAAAPTPSKGRAAYVAIHGTPFRRRSLGHVLCLAFKMAGCRPLRATHLSRAVAAATGKTPASVVGMLSSCGMFENTARGVWRPGTYLLHVLQRSSEDRMAAAAEVSLDGARTAIGTEFALDGFRGAASAPGRPTASPKPPKRRRPIPEAPPPPSPRLRTGDGTSAVDPSGNPSSVVTSVLTTSLPDGLTADQVVALCGRGGLDDETVRATLIVDPSFVRRAGRWVVTDAALASARLSGLTPDVVSVPLSSMAARSPS